MKRNHIKKYVLFIILLTTTSLFADSMLIESDSFQNGTNIPLKFAADGVEGGQNISPQLMWDNFPADTKSYAILMWDKHPIAQKWVHWAVKNIPANTTELPEGASGKKMPKGSVELINTSKTKGYFGPQPPAGSGKHEYLITIYALNVSKLKLYGKVSRKKFLRAIKGKVIDQATIKGYFEVKE